MKAQTQAVTAVMMTGILIGGIVSAYLFGVPMVEKRQNRAEVQQLESSVLEVEEKIDSVAKSGKGVSDSVEVSLESGDVFINSTGNYIDIEAVAPDVSYSSDWSFLKGRSRQGLTIGAGDYGERGEHHRGIVAVRSLSAEGSLVRYRIEFRNMNTSTPSGPELRLVDIEDSGVQEASGQFTLDFTNEGRKRDQNYQLSTGGQINRLRTVIEVEVR